MYVVPETYHTFHTGDIVYTIEHLGGPKCRGERGNQWMRNFVVARLLDAEKMAVLCRDFGISRQTGDKIFNRYKESGLHGLEERSRRPYRYANQLPFQVERAILPIKREYDYWALRRFEIN